MTKILGMVVLQLSTLGSFIGLYLTVYPSPHERPWWHWALLIFTSLVTLFLVFAEVRSYLRNAPKSYKTNEKINAYMRRWISSGGRAVIFSRDMSWAQDRTTKDILIQKAHNGELTLCVEHSLPIIEELRAAGAAVINYGGLHVPRSRFTIVDFEKEGARVAVGAKQNGVHVIQEYRNGEHPFFGVAEDLVKILAAMESRK